MTWGKMDDKFHRNRKVRELRRMKGGREALGDWAFWWSWCLDDPKLDGVVPAFELDAADLRSAKLLVDVGLWDAVEGGYRFHDFHEYNPTRDQRESKLRADRERVATKRGASRTDVARDTDATPKRVASESPPTRVPVPSRPDPDPSESASHSGAREVESHVGRSSTERFLDSMGTTPAESRLQVEVIRAFDSVWHAVTGRHLGTNARSTPNLERAASLLAWARTVAPAAPLEAIQNAAGRAACDPKASTSGSPFAWFCSSPGTFHEPVAAAPNPRATELRAEAQKLTDRLELGQYENHRESTALKAQRKQLLDEARALETGAAA